MKRESAKWVLEIKSVKYVKTPLPEGWSDTDCSIPDTYHIVFDDDTETDIYIDIRNKPIDELLMVYIYGIGERRRFPSRPHEYITNSIECFEKWVDEVVENGRCPYSKKEIMDYYKDELEFMIKSNKYLFDVAQKKLEKERSNK